MGQPEVEAHRDDLRREEGASTSIEAGDHTARITVKLKPGLTSADEVTLIDRIGKFHASGDETRSLLSGAVHVQESHRGRNPGSRSQHAEAAQSRSGNRAHESVPGLVDLRSTLQSGHPEIQVIYNRDRLAEYGLTLRNVADLVRNKVQGRAATQFRQEDQMIDIVVRLRRRIGSDSRNCAGLVVNPGAPVAIPLASVAA